MLSTYAKTPYIDLVIQAIFTRMKEKLFVQRKLIYI